jgi:hypothetical protein
VGLYAGLLKRVSQQEGTRKKEIERSTPQIGIQYICNNKTHLVGLEMEHKQMMRVNYRASKSAVIAEGN